MNNVWKNPRNSTGLEYLLEFEESWEKNQVGITDIYLDRLAPDLKCFIIHPMTSLLRPSPVVPHCATKHDYNCYKGYNII